ncbi:MAG: M50 family metallopeptidase [Candidatus Thiodiazotropha sp.]
MKYSFFILTALAFLISAIPIIHYPFGWFETFFHELSHGMAALVTGGSVHRIELNIDGSGLCTTSGGMEFLILLAGYTGSALWGSLIYLSVSLGKARYSKQISAILTLVVLLVALLWARDLITIAILFIMTAIFAMAYRYGSRNLTRLFIEFIALYVVLNAIRSPLYLLDGRDIGDGAALSQMTHIPEIFWVVAWCLIACGCLYFLFKKTIIFRK